ncbi:Hypothetical protein SCLAV_4393 [Streptomyces clavuligerus]|uniref:Uncharacterized protein n=1 Tax=Streptomyces clavuligerus TaxID=1901 RepID=B5GVE6_STRCL|nr:hypothetical protein SSCG_03320 [Streptomyces clavuligerus]EFG09464.1 Hypothetical protein SCLAV_4393 [Streptomyces clavuligerus]
MASATIWWETLCAGDRRSGGQDEVPLLRALVYWWLPWPGQSVSGGTVSLPVGPVGWWA